MFKKSVIEFESNWLYVCMYICRQICVRKLYETPLPTIVLIFKKLLINKSTAYESVTKSAWKIIVHFKRKIAANVSEWKNGWKKDLKPC